MVPAPSTATFSIRLCMMCFDNSGSARIKRFALQISLVFRFIGKASEYYSVRLRCEHEALLVLR